MHVIKALNIRDALPQAIDHVLQDGNTEATRNGEAMVAPEPVAINYIYPKKHVLIDPNRDANPFFHLMEAMWMLAGRDDSAFLDHYVSYFSEMFAHHGTVLDAYGQRWRYGLQYNQLDEIVNQLRKDHNTRQAVLQMWNAGRDDLRAYSSKPCNLVITFRIIVNQLDMVVFNRSNDLIWGCCGANAVHFSILQEYLAARIGVKLGEYWQITTNLHLYAQHYEMAAKINSESYNESTTPLVLNPRVFDAELFKTMDFIDDLHKGNTPLIDHDITNTFLTQTVARMATAHYLHKHGHKADALDVINSVEAEDWKRAGKEWLERRYARE